MQLGERNLSQSRSDRPQSPNPPLAELTSFYTPATNCLWTIIIHKGTQRWRLQLYQRQTFNLVRFQVLQYNLEVYLAVIDSIFVLAPYVMPSDNRNMWLDSPRMQTNDIDGSEQYGIDLQYWLSWDQLHEGTAYTANSSSFQRDQFNQSWLDRNNSHATSPSTLFEDAIDSPTYNFSNMKTNSSGLWPNSTALDDNALSNLNRSAWDHSQQTAKPLRPSGPHNTISQSSINTIAPHQLQASVQPRPAMPKHMLRAHSDSSMATLSTNITQSIETTSSDCGDSEYAGSRRSSVSSVSPPPDPQPKQQRRNKRTSVDAVSSSSSKRSKRPGAVVDKKYRDKLKDKMAELKLTVPTTRAAPDGEGGDDEDEVSGLTPATNSRKPTILTKAIEYIHYLEDRNAKLSAQMAWVRSGAIV